MSDATRIQRAREALAGAIDVQVSDFYDQLVIVWRRLDQRLADTIRAASEASPSAIIRAQRTRRLKQEIERAMADAGFADLVDVSTGADLDAIVTEVEALRVVVDLSAFGAADQVRIDALKVLAGSDVLAEGEAVAQALWKATVEGVFSARPAAAILADLGDVLDYAAPQIRTLYDTSISVFAREAEALGTADDPDRAFVYTGPNDQKVRPFCRQQLGKVFTRKTIDTLDNGQLPNVFLTAGGYNCRHGWTAVSTFSDLATLADTDARVPEFSHGIEAGGAKAA